MRRRRAHTPMVTEPVSEKLANTIQDLEDAQRALKDLTRPDVAPTASALRDLTDQQLQDFRDTLETCRSENLAALKQWELYAKHLQSGLDGALLMSSLKTEPETKKRRRTTARSEFSVGSSVAYRITNRKPPDDEWILAEVVKVIQEGVTYEVQDPEPDENNKMGQLYKANVRDIIAIPSSHTATPIYPPGTSVIALYPETTTFYRAEVVSTKATRCRLIFYGEEDGRKETEVDRHYVLRPA